MSNVIELWPGIMQSEPLTPPMDLSDPLQEADVLGECRRFALSVFQLLTGLPDDVEIARAINILSSTTTILRSLHAGREAREASRTSREVERLCSAAIQAAERL